MLNDEFEMEAMPQLFDASGDHPFSPHIHGYYQIVWFVKVRFIGSIKVLDLRALSFISMKPFSQMRGGMRMPFSSTTFSMLLMLDLISGFVTLASCLCQT